MTRWVSIFGSCVGFSMSSHDSHIYTQNAKKCETSPPCFAILNPCLSFLPFTLSLLFGFYFFCATLKCPLSRMWELIKKVESPHHKTIRWMAKINKTCKNAKKCETSPPCFAVLNPCLSFLPFTLSLLFGFLFFCATLKCPLSWVWELIKKVGSSHHKTIRWMAKINKTCRMGCYIKYVWWYCCFCSSLFKLTS